MPDIIYMGSNLAGKESQDGHTGSYFSVDNKPGRSRHQGNPEQLLNDLGDSGDPGIADTIKVAVDHGGNTAKGKNHCQDAKQGGCLLDAQKRGADIV